MRLPAFELVQYGANGGNEPRRNHWRDQYLHQPTPKCCHPVVGSDPVVFRKQIPFGTGPIWVPFGDSGPIWGQVRFGDRSVIVAIAMRTGCHHRDRSNIGRARNG